MRALIALLMLATAMPVAAQTLIASQTEHKHTWGIVKPGTEAAQTFTVGIGSGGDLDRIELWFSKVFQPDPVLSVQIRNLVEGEPGSVVWDFGTFLFSTLPPFSEPKDGEQIVFTVPPAQVVPLTEGVTYAIVLGATGGISNGYVQWAGGENELAGETAFSRLTTGSATWVDLTTHGIDRHFEVYIR